MRNKEPFSSPSEQVKSGFIGRILQLYRTIQPDLLFYASVPILTFAGKLYYSLAPVRGLLFLLEPVTFL